MTAEIIVANTSAVALAADSAVTSTLRDSHKIYNTANKLFALSSYHPVGIMIYGSATFMGIPWETIIKVFRKEIGRGSKPRVQDYVDWFFEFLESSKTLFPQTLRDESFQAQTMEFLYIVRKEVIDATKIALEDQPDLNLEQIQTIFSTVVDGIRDHTSELKSIDFLQESEKTIIRSRSSNIVADVAGNVFEKLKVTPDILGKLKEIVYALLTAVSGDSGIAFAGFGEAQHFPAVSHFTVGDFILNRVKRYGNHKEVGRKSSAAIVPLAQSDIVQLFVDGIHPSLKRRLKEIAYAEMKRLSGLVIDEASKVASNKDIADLRNASKTHLKSVFSDLEKLVDDETRESFSSRILEIVRLLPKEELAFMAESLVNLTSFHKRVTLDAETVGGPVDVALISKGDGFVWIKRKHYFPPVLNTQYFKNVMFGDILKPTEECEK